MKLKTQFLTLFLFCILFSFVFYYKAHIGQSIHDYAIHEAQQKFSTQALSPHVEEKIRSIAQELKIDREFIIRKMNPAALIQYGYCNAFVYFYNFLNCIPICSMPFLFVSEGFFEDLSHEEQRFLIGHELVHLQEEHTRYLNLVTFVLVFLAFIFSLFMCKRLFKKMYLSDLRLYRCILIFILWSNLSLISLGNCAYRRYIERVADSKALTTLHAYEGAFKVIDRWHKEFKVPLHNPYYGLFANHPSCNERRAYCLNLKNNERNI